MIDNYEEIIDKMTTKELEETVSKWVWICRIIPTYQMKEDRK